VIGGKDIYKGVTESQRSRWRGRNLGIVFQFFQLMPMLTLVENVMLPMDLAEMYEFDERPERARDLLTLVGLESDANKLPVLVSAGQQQSAAIARALACDPPLLVADEPTAPRFKISQRDWTCSAQSWRGYHRHGHTRSI
jgi:putative ABC transport system ATP-binding protein